MASLTIYGPSGYLVLEIDPFGANSGYDSPPPIEQVVTRSRAVVVHPIPGREGNRKQDMGRDDDELTLSGIALGDDANFIDGMASSSNSGQHYVITDEPDFGPGMTYPNMWLKRISTGRRKGTSNWFTFAMTFVEQSQEDSDA